MVSALKVRKVLLTRLVFDRLVSSSISADTMGKSSKALGGDDFIGSGSWYPFIFPNMDHFPLPTRHLVPLLMTSKLLWMLRHAYDGLQPSLAPKILVCGKYFALRILEIRESGLVRILQAYLASMAKLKA